MPRNHTPDEVQTEIARLCAEIGSTDSLAAYIIAIRDLEHLANVEWNNGNVEGKNEILGTIRHMQRTHGKRIEALVNAASPYSRENYYRARNTSTKAA